ncbi:porin POR1 ASCRUDRAFT_74274 [Ascoidea rubescens DSM 1968]|uniref:Mitochondrial outer membrane protein porin n=1 Tax=Ascoidea rubescens DSM 1968 TaxID=1344418 RepID=A0A1D2VMH8_9ASCO|nr:hypothetical protein ASCRUDRAFT_74274 [Ascoidea rubescens DSM 1968]ODV62809.1 hypothetical protein ASCRUDRAFT_74274 [Ascoidea rubescens DSM 1968]
MAPPAYSDISKNSNGLLNKDFYHLSKASLDVKTVAPNGVAFSLKGKTGKDDSISSNLETKYTDKASGLTLTQGWNTSNSLDTKIEVKDAGAPGIKAEFVSSVVPSGPKGARLNLFFAQQSVSARAFFNLLKGPTFVGDISIGHDGFLAGSEVAYDIGAAKVTKYSAAVGFSTPVYSFSVTGLNNLSLYQAAYYHKVSPFVEAGARATYDIKNGANAGKPVAIEFATKYSLDRTAFVKAKIADSGLAALSYSQQLRPGVTLGIGASFDALRLAEPVHKLGFSLSFSA